MTEVLTCFFSCCCISAYPLPRLAAVSWVARRRDRCLIWAWVPAAAMGVYVAWNWAGIVSGNITCDKGTVT